MHHKPIARKRKWFLLAVSVCLALLLVPPLAEAKPQNKVQVCHIPPEDPDNFHTIVINESALETHLAHGDREGPCQDFCEELCNDDNVCTQDTCPPDEKVKGCVPVAERPTVDCTDGDPSTRDFCDAAQEGCVNLPITAEPQDLFTNGATSLEITLRGNDPSKQDLTFSITQDPDPSKGTLSALAPIVPDPIPDGQGGYVQPPITSAMVTYTANDPASNAADSFTFKVEVPETSEGVGFATAVVSINPEGDPTPEPPVLEDIIATDLVVDTLQDRSVNLTLQGDAPDTVSLTFAITQNPDPGSLGQLTQGPDEPGSPRRTASVTYTPEQGFVGADSFVFQACDNTDPNNPICDTATATINVGELVVDQVVETRSDQPVTINLGNVQAAFLDGAEIAGNVADANGDGFGDNHNVLPGSAPVLMSAAVDASGGPGSNGTMRIHIEWDLAGLKGLANELESAQVVLHTRKGSIDSLDTFFFVGTEDGDGELTADDFETSIEASSIAVMPVPDVPQGTEGTFSFDVTQQLSATLASDKDFFIIQGRVDESLAGDGYKRGLEVRTTATANLEGFLEPQLSITTPGLVAPPTITILSLPSSGTLLDALGNPVVVNEPLPGPTVTYQPVAGSPGTVTFQYQIDDGLSVDNATVTIQVTPTDCVEARWPPGCAP